MPKFDSYVICTSPRSGSTLLCKLLAATGISGKPESYFHTPSADDWAKALDLTLTDAASEQEALAEIFEAVRAKGRGNTSIFGLRLQRHSVDYFLQKLAQLHPGHTTDLPRFEAAFGRAAFIHLTRMDKVEQAVSYLKAEQTGLWHQAPDGTELERISPPAPPQYDAAAIQERYDRFQAFVTDGAAGSRLRAFIRSVSPMKRSRLTRLAHCVICWTGLVWSEGPLRV
nr:MULTISPECIES: Stf0 family sulfotransferase [unclassified Roseobacter]